MQTSVSRACQGLKPLSARRSVARTPAFGTTSSRRSSVQVFAMAKKGKGGIARQGAVPGQMELIRREPPVPEVDPENSEFVLFFRALKYKEPMVKEEIGPSAWVPITIIKGNQALNFIGKAMLNPWGAKLYSRTLIWQLGAGLYQDKEAVEKRIKENMPIFQKVAFRDFEFSFKLRDKENPKDWIKAEGITVIPPESELGVLGIDVLKKFFSLENLSTLFKAPEAPGSSAPAQQ